jgi:hypothetical protein
MKPMPVLTAAALALILTGAASAQMAPRAGHGPHHGDGEHRRAAMALMMLGAADYDGDNTVTRAEVERLQSEEFAFRDRNGDGYLDEADASPTRQRLAAMRPDGAEGGPRRRAPRAGGEDREPVDANGDGRISRAEFLGRELVIFDRLDANGDDAVSPEEIDAAMESRRERRGARRDGLQWWRD